MLSACKYNYFEKPKGLKRKAHVPTTTLIKYDNHKIENYQCCAVIH